MELHLYWISAITYVVVLGILMYAEVTSSKIPTNLEKSCRVMTNWVIFFCLQDVLWGLCAARIIKSDAVFFVSSSIFHISTVVTTFFWLKYVLDYMGDQIKHKTICLAIDVIIIFAELALVITNFFTTTLFKIVDGCYVTGPYRKLTFVNQYIVYLIIGIIALILVFKKDGSDSKNYKTVFIFALAPIVLGICQLMFPEAPFYSMGYFLGCIIIHIFVVANDRETHLSDEAKYKKIEELNNTLASKQEELKEQFEILTSISGVYDYINLVDLVDNTAHLFGHKDSVIDSFDIANDPRTSLNKKLSHDIIKDHYDRFLEFTDLSTLDKRMHGKKLIVNEFRCNDDQWLHAMYIRIGDNVNAPITQVAYALRNITQDRKREQLIYSALTNLVYSLHIFNLEDDTMDRLIESDVFKKIVGNETSAQKMSYTIINATCKDEYLDIMLEFVNLSTVSERMKGKKSLTIEFVGKYHGWTRMTFIPSEISKNKVKKLVVITEIIDSEKNELMNLIYKSSTDELTRLYNRRTYEEDLDSITKSKDMNDLVIVAMDVNGLKTVNDTIGHKAGDELIIGASQCISKSFTSVGKNYRTGGDEFMSIIRCKEKDLPGLFAKFEQSVDQWSGNLVNSLSISYGYALAKDYSGHAVRDLASEADKKMYEAKDEYYRKNGIERRRT